MEEIGIQKGRPVSESAKVRAEVIAHPFPYLKPLRQWATRPLSPIRSGMNRSFVVPDKRQ